MKSSEVEIAVNNFMRSINFNFGNVHVNSRILDDLRYTYDAFTDSYAESSQTFKRFLGITFVDESNSRFGNTLYFSFLHPNHYQSVFKTNFIVNNIEVIESFLKYITPLVLQTIETLNFCEQVTKSNALPASFYRTSIINDFLKQNT